MIFPLYQPTLNKIKFCYIFQYYFSVADPDPGSMIRCFFLPLGRDLEPGLKIKSGSEMNIPDHFLRASKQFWGYKYRNTLMRVRFRDLFDPGSGIRDGKIRIRDPVLTSRIRNTAILLSAIYTNSKPKKFGFREFFSRHNFMTTPIARWPRKGPVPEFLNF
jgi:hypothetical protein